MAESFECYKKQINDWYSDATSKQAFINAWTQVTNESKTWVETMEIQEATLSKVIGI